MSVSQIYKATKIIPTGPRKGYMSSHNKNGVVLRCVEFTHEVEKALKEAGIPCGKEY